MHGQRGTDPTEPPASGPYAFLPVTHEPLIQELSDNLGRAGYHPLPAPTGIMLNEGDLPHSKCIKCDMCPACAGASQCAPRDQRPCHQAGSQRNGTRSDPRPCDGFPCLVHAKADDFDFLLGNIQMFGKSQGPMFAGDAPAFAPGFALDRMARHSVDFWLTTEDLPDPNNRVSLNKQGEITLNYTFNKQEPTQRLRAKLQSMLKLVDRHPHLIPNKLYLGKTIPIAGVARQAGTCRFGKDPKASVLDTDCKAHELDNLYVVDTSFFVSIGAVNPSLTTSTMAFRVGDHLLERLR